MLATFVIGLREGLEAVLIVSIIAAFLKRNRAARWPMWCGVALAVLISAGVGIALRVLEQSLPQTGQEALESIIGLIAVVFVTGMIFWMTRNARGLKGELEIAAGAAVGRGTGWALAVMAFLAVVKEGFETAVFLLATLQASTSAGTAALGALAGILAACVLGWLIYSGGTRLNLGKFFTVSSAFLVFVAAGVLLTAVRTAHGAGWLTIGQQRTLDLSWLAPIGSIRSALITGVLGIPADPRVIEVLVWLGYLVPVLLIALWPRRWRLAPARVPLVRFALAAAAAVAAVVLPLAIPAGGPDVPATATLAAGTANPDRGPGTATAAVHDGGAVLEVRSGAGAQPGPQTVRFPVASRTATTHLGVPATRWTARTSPAADDPAMLTIGQLADLFGRVPVGISTVQDPGPYHAAWARSATTTLWLTHGGILDMRRTDRITLTLSGGGLAHPRTLTLTEPYWAVPERAAAATGEQVAAAERTARERALWRVWVPIALAVAAAGLALAGWRSPARPGRPTTGPRAPTTRPAPTPHEPTRRSTSHAVP